MVNHKSATGRLWSVPGNSKLLMHIIATIEHGSTEQVDACLPVAAALDRMSKTTPLLNESMVKGALDAHPVYRCNHMCATSLPNLVPNLIKACLAAHRPANRTVDPLGHVLNKAWPMRCSVRNFSDIVSGYIKTEASIYRFVLIVLHACMLGAYPHSKTTASVAIRILLYRCFQQERLSPHQLACWVKQNNHLLLFIAIKEYISYSISLVPGLSTVLHDAYNWKVFADSVQRQADGIRTTLNNFAGPPSEIFNAARDAVGTVRSYKCPVAPVDYHAICENLQGIARASFHPQTDVYRTPLRTKMYYIIRPLIASGAPFEEVAVTFGIDPHAARVLQQSISQGSSACKWKEAKRVKCSSAQEALALHEFVQAWVMCHQIFTFRLPAHIVHEQRQIGMSAGREIYACACCRQLREFVVDDKCSNNAWACGHHKVLLDDSTGQVYCGKRAEKTTVPARKPSTDNCRSFWKSQQSLMCGCCPLLRINMDGYMLSFFGKLYVLCPSCACVMRLNADQYYASSYRCTNCRYRKDTSQPDRCFHCYVVSSDLDTVALRENTVHVCGTCTRRWMADDSLTRNVDEEVAHQAINERWSTSRVSVYCASI